MDDFGFNEWSLPNGTELDDARDGESSSGFLAALRKDYQSNPARTPTARSATRPTTWKRR
ncbi:hypothetical protein NKG94_44480 [Micromonospora sp. M12]